MVRQGEERAARRIVVGATAAITSPLVIKVVAVTAAVFLFLIVLIGATFSSLGTSAAQGQSCTVQGEGPDAREIPAKFVPYYRDAAERYELGPRGFSILAAIHKHESGFGKNMGPSSAGAIGHMQFMPATWAAYGVDGDGDGKKDPFNHADAIPAAARYLKASGAPTDWERALFAYNHADWYVKMILETADRFGGEVVCTGAFPIDAGAAQPQKAVKLFQPRSYARMPGWAHSGGGAAGWPQQSCDARMSANLLWVLATYELRIHDCRASGHATHGDGTAADIVPKEDPYPKPGALGQMDAWERVRAAAELLGWRRSCGGNGCIGASTMSPAIRAVFYNGFSNHGDPKEWRGSPGCSCPHVHISWMSSAYGNSGLVAPNEWTMAFPINGQILTGTAGFEGEPA